MTKERILIVDDEQSVVRSCERILKRHGFEVVGKTESHTVADLLRQETFDVLLTDIKMPKVDGLELLRIAKEIDPHITVVIITGYGTMEDAIKALRLGARGFLMKPFSPKELIEAVEESLTRRALLRDSVRLQTLLPFLEINKILQVSGGEISLVQQVLKIASRQIDAHRLAWFMVEDNSGSAPAPPLAEAAVVSHTDAPSQLPAPMLDQALSSSQPVWLLADGHIVTNLSGHANIVGAALPLLIKGKAAGLLTAEAAPPGQGSPFGPISLDLLPILSGQLAIIIENVQLFQQTEALRAFNEDIIQNMTNGLLAVNGAGKITALNPAASAMLGCQPAQILQRPLAQALTGADSLIEIFKATLTSGQAQPRREITIAPTPERKLTISVSTAPLNIHDGGAVGVLEDLSEIKALEAEHRRLDRLAALGEMSAVVAHELRNPIAGIAAGIEYLTRNAPAGSADQQGALMIQKEIERVNRILEDILFVARPLQLKLGPAALPAIIEAVLQACQPQIIANRVDVTTNYIEPLPDLLADSQRLEQVFTNLVLNAVQAMPNGGQLAIKIEAENGRKNIRISVADTGAGITPHLLARIFDPFFTTKTKGTGLGLSVAHRIIEAHQGVIKVDSKPGQGTRFLIILPVEMLQTDAD